MALGVCYTTADSEKDVRDYWRGWSVQELSLIHI